MFWARTRTDQTKALVHLKSDNKVNDLNYLNENIMKPLAATAQKNH